MILVWRPSFISSLQKQTIIKYLSEDLDYKQYCDLGKNNRISKPFCPYCKRTGCLIGHGWYARKGLSGAEDGFLPFWIRRFYCKTTRKTVSMHPRFSHTRKRYVLQHVIAYLSAILDKAIEMLQETSRVQVPRQTLKRWLHSFSNMHSEAKRICYHLTGPPQDCLGKQMLCHFRKTGTGTLCDNAATAMVCLFEEFYRPLY